MKKLVSLLLFLTLVFSFSVPCQAEISPLIHVYYYMWADIFGVDDLRDEMKTRKISDEETYMVMDDLCMVYYSSTLDVDYLNFYINGKNVKRRDDASQELRFCALCAAVDYGSPEDRLPASGEKRERGIDLYRQIGQTILETAKLTILIDQDKVDAGTPVEFYTNNNGQVYTICFVPGLGYNIQIK